MSIMEELEQQNFYKPNGRPPYSAAMIRYALLLRYTSALLQQEGVDSIRALKKMRDKGKIFEDLVLMADEMFLQNTVEYSGGEYIGADAEGNLFKGIVAFMVVGVKSSTPYVIEASPEVSINGNWLANEIDGCVSILAENGFKVRAVVTDNHSINVTAFSVLKKEIQNSE